MEKYFWLLWCIHCNQYNWIVNTTKTNVYYLIQIYVDISFCFIIKLLIDSLELTICWSKTSFHPTNSWTYQVWGRTVQKETGLDNSTYKCIYPTGCITPKFYGLPKIHKPDTTLRPIMSSRGSVTYGVAKVLTNILKPLIGKSQHHIYSIQHFVEQANEVTLLSGECLHSYDVTACSLQFQ